MFRVKLEGGRLAGMVQKGCESPHKDRNTKCACVFHPACFEEPHHILILAPLKKQTNKQKRMSYFLGSPYLRWKGRFV